MTGLIETLNRVLDVTLFRLGETAFTVWTLLYLTIFLAVLFYLSGVIRHWLISQVLSRTTLPLGERDAVGSIFRYVVIVIGLLIAVQTAGIDLTTLNIIAATVGIGIGFGLQNVANNFISGLIILLERPLRIGDRIDVGGVQGNVVKIGARGTTIVTNDNISIIVPNSKFMTENVVNWSHTDAKVRFRVPVTASYGTDVRLVERILLEVANNNRDVLKEPAPAVRLVEFGENGIAFELLVWSSSLVHRKGFLVSSLNFAIFDAFAHQNLTFPYPQRDIHIRNVPIDLKPESKVTASS